MILAPILLLGLLIGIYLYTHSGSLPQQPVKVVEIETISPSTIQKKVSLIGTIHPKHTTILVAKGSGLLDILLVSGQKVKKGDLIAKIINPDVEKNDQLSKDAEEIANTQYTRFLNLQKKGFISAREVEEKKQAWIQAQKDVAKTKMELKNMRFYSPFDGIIGAFKIREGAQVNEGEAVVTVYDPLTLAVDVDIPCQHLKQIQENQPVTVFNKPYHLSHLQRMMDNETHMCPADVDVICTNCVIGAAINVQLLIKEKQNALVIPTEALFLQDGALSVYKVTKNHIELVTVKQGIAEKDKVEIVSGLKPGDRVIIKSPERLYPGLKVSIAQSIAQQSQG